MHFNFFKEYYLISFYLPNKDKINELILKGKGKISKDANILKQLIDIRWNNIFIFLSLVGAFFIGLML